MRRLPTICHLWPAVAPHGPDVATSIWNLPHSVFVSLAAGADEHDRANRDAGKLAAGPGSIRHRVG